MGAHAPGSSVASLNGRGIGCGIAQLVKHLMGTFLRTMCITEVYLKDATALTMFDNLNVRQCARDAVAYIRQTTSTPVSTGAIGLSENLWKQAGIAVLAVG